MRRFGLAERNLRHNRECSNTLPKSGMINGQGLGAIPELRYGLCRMSFNGCSCIAVYNALEYLGKTQPLADIVFYMERFRVLGGFFGCNAFKIGKALRHFGAVPQTDSDIEKAEAFVVCFWTGKIFLSSLHTVFCVRENNEIIVYNRYNNRGSVKRYKTLMELTNKRKPVSAFVLA